MEPLLVEQQTKEGIKLLDISGGAMDPFGFSFQDSVRTPLGLAQAVGVNSGNLWFLVDGDIAATYWSSCKSADDFAARGFEKQNPVARPAAVDTKDYHSLKRCRVGGSDRIIVMQSANGPCPVIALANARAMVDCALATELELAFTKSTVITAEDLRTLVLAELLSPRVGTVSRFCETENKGETLATLVRNSEAMSKIHTSVVEGGQAMLRRFYDGLNVDPIFDSVDGFAAESDASLFALAGLRLVHGWVMDPSDEGELKSLRSMSYSQLSCVCLDDDAGNAQAEARRFLDSNPGQLTELGLALLGSELEVGEYAVLFQNNHFGTVVKSSGSEGPLLRLVTDVAFTEVRAVVFEEVTVHGDGSYFDGDGNRLTAPVMRFVESYGNKFPVGAVVRAVRDIEARGGKPDLATVEAELNAV